MLHAKSEEHFTRAGRFMPGGVNSPVRAFGSVGGTPVVVEKASGSTVTDLDGNEYLDFVASWGPMLFGHAHPTIVEAVQRAAEKGTSFGAPTVAETELAERISNLVPSIEMLRLVSSGTEAAMSAIRLARGATGRDAVVKFAGCYHGHSDSFLIKAGSGALTLGEPNSPGVTAGCAKDTLLAEYNDLESVRKCFEARPDGVAAVIVEPVPGNMGVVPPEPGFLEGLRSICDEYGALLIFDEVITGFRLSAGGAQKLLGVLPDLTVLGKIIGGGLPVGAFGGSRDLMQKMSPTGPVYQAGTLSGNPLATAAGNAMMELIETTPNLYEDLERKAARMEKELREAVDSSGLPGVINRVGSMMTLFFTDVPEVNSFSTACTTNAETYGKWFHGNLDRGVYYAPAAYEAAFVSAVHSDEDIAKACETAKAVLAEIGKAGS